MLFYSSVNTYGDKILIRGYNKGKRISVKSNYKPTVYFPTKKKTESKYKTYLGDPLEPFNPGTIKETKEFIRKWKNEPNFEIYGMENFAYSFIAEKFPQKIDYDSSLIRKCYIDIEVESEQGFPEPDIAPEPVNAITLMQNDKIITLGCGDFVTNDPNIEYYKCSDEKSLLRSFLTIWENLDPDIVSGWFCEIFDIPYLVNRITKILGRKEANRLSPWKTIMNRKMIVNGQETKFYELYGISIIDYLDLYLKYGVQNAMESKKLDHVAYVELGEKKIDYSEYASLQHLYKENYQKFIEYNIHDVVLVNRLENKLKLLEMIISMTYMSKVNYLDCFKQTRMWDSIIYNFLREKNIIIPLRKDNYKRDFEGAFVKNPIPGMYEWVVSFDLASLYPHLIMMYNIGPDTIVEGKHSSFNIDDVIELKIKNSSEYSLAANGFYFRKDKKSFLSELMEKLYNDRKVIKKEALKAEEEYQKTKLKKFKDQAQQLNVDQLAKKVTLNSCYGAIGNQYFRWFDVRQAEAITLSGQLSIRWIADKLNLFLNKNLKTEGIDYVIAIDTDSVYLNLKDFVNEFCEYKEKEEIINWLDKLSRKILQPLIDKQYEKLSSIMNTYDQKMFMDREVIADRGIWTAKKRYMLNVWDKEGVRYKRPYIKIMGIESVKSSTPECCRKRIKNLIRIILNKDEKSAQQYIKLFKKKFSSLPFEDISFPRSVSYIQKYSEGDYYIKGTPIHTKGSIIYNKLLKEYKLTKKYEKIKEGNKVKFAYLKLPNPIGEEVISINDYLPEEFGLNDFIDYNKQFQKAFLQPVDIILNTINWNSKKQPSLADLME